MCNSSDTTQRGTLFGFYHTWENFGGEFGKFGESWTIHQNFPCQYSHIHHKCIWYTALSVAYYLYGSLKFPLPIEVFPVAVVVLDMKHLK